MSTASPTPAPATADPTPGMHGPAPSTQLPAVLTRPYLTVVPWRDAVVDRVGFDVRSTYVELFWLSVLGPTSTWLLRRIVTGLDEYPLGYELDLGQTAGALGLSWSPATSNPFSKALHRCVMFGAAHLITNGIAVRRRLPLVGERHLRRMPVHLRAAHEPWARAGATPAVDPDERARIIADALLAAGDEPDVVERELLGLGVAPATVLDVLRRLEPDAA